MTPTKIDLENQIKDLNHMLITMGKYDKKTPDTDETIVISTTIEMLENILKTM